MASRDRHACAVACRPAHLATAPDPAAQVVLVSTPRAWTSTDGAPGPPFSGFPAPVRPPR